MLHVQPMANGANDTVPLMLYRERETKTQRYGRGFARFAVLTLVTGDPLTVISSMLAPLISSCLCIRPYRRTAGERRMSNDRRIIIITRELYNLN